MNPFIDPEGYRAYVRLKEKAIRDPPVVAIREFSPSVSTTIHVKT